MEQEILKRLPEALLPWYEVQKRDLPWRQDRQPYHVWLSEIMLQQTRVEAVKGYYQRFLQTLPTLEDLANCPEEQLLKLWEGLGYYSRARNLKKAAQKILAEHDGVFPGEYAQVLALPGVGAYTAGAVCSICYDLPTPAVDGNVLRLTARLLNDDTPIDLPAQKEKISRALAAVYPKEAGAFTQALMELGATLCGPNRKPDCENCPCKDFCLGNQLGTAQALPVKNGKAKRREADMTVLILECDGRYALTKRENKGLLASLWQFPNVPGRLTPNQAVEAAENFGAPVRQVLRSTEKRHIFTHIQWNMLGYWLEAESPGGDFRWLSPEEIDKTAALPTAFRQFWEDRFHV